MPRLVFWPVGKLDHWGADKAYDVTDFVEDLREREVTPHIAINGALSKLGKARKTAVDRRTARHAGYAVSQILRSIPSLAAAWYGAGYSRIDLRRVAR